MAMVSKHDKILKLISKYINLDRADVTQIELLFEPTALTKRTLLEQENKIARYLYFVNSGFVRIFYNKDGSEITTHINCPPGFITSYNSFTTSTLALDNVECITPCELLRITKSSLNALCEQSKKWTEFSRIIYDQSLTYNEQRTKDMLTLTAEQRYQKLISEYPEIIQHVPLQYISSFLGIEPQSLSRIRRKIIS